MSLHDLVELARRYGVNPQWAPDGRGSVSLKEKNTLRIISDGVSLADCTEELFVALDRRKVAAIVRGELPEEPLAREREAWSLLLEARRAGQQQVPPAEALLHEAARYAFAAYTHPPLVNGICCAVEGEAAAARLFDGAVTWVPQASIGVEAARALARGIAGRRSDSGGEDEPVLAALVRNNGLLIAADSVEQLRKVERWVIETVRGAVGRLPDLGPVAYDVQAAELIALQISRRAEQWDRSGVRYRTALLTNRELARFVRSAGAFTPLAEPLCIHHVVPLGHRIPFLSLNDDMIAAGRAIAEEIERYGEEAGWVPPALAVAGLGVFVTGRNRREMDVTAAMLLDAIQIAVDAQDFGGAAALPQEQIDLCLRWAGSEN